MNRQNKKLLQKIRLKVATNLVLGVLILSVGSLCLSTETNALKTKGEKSEIYRFAGVNAVGVSLTFNVYQGTKEVESILKILSNYQAKATFFIGGCWADDNVECLKKIASQGHEIGNHGYFHKDHAKLDFEANKKEIEACNQFIKLAIGQSVCLFAPPSGAYGESMLSACETLKMKTILWSRDTIDWRDQNAALIYTRATKNIQKGEFVLMHPTPATVEALSDVLKYYETQNLKAVTVSENLNLK
jgi:peptidoglycan/xylan/chitin deacetylase (PgdA/CDA1 family)